MDFRLLSIYLSLHFISNAVLFLRFRKWRSERIAVSTRRWGYLQIFGVSTSFLYALWDASPDNLFLAFFSPFLHRVASSLTAFAFIVLLTHSFKLFRVNRPRYTRFSLCLANVCSLILITTPVQQFADLAAGFEGDLPDWQISLRDEASRSRPEDPDPGVRSFLLFMFIFAQLARWGIVVVKAILVAISLDLKIISLKTSSANRRLASWLVLGTVIVLLQEPFLVNACLAFTGRDAHITRRIHAILDPIFFTLIYECITTIGYWQNEGDSEEAEDTGTFASTFSRQMQAFRDDFNMLNLFENR